MNGVWHFLLSSLFSLFFIFFVGFSFWPFSLSILVLFLKVISTGCELLINSVSWSGFLFSFRLGFLFSLINDGCCFFIIRWRPKSFRHGVYSMCDTGSVCPLLHIDLFLLFLCWLGKWAINLRIRQGYLNLMVSAHGCLVGKWNCWVAPLSLPPLSIQEF